MGQEKQQKVYAIGDKVTFDTLSSRKTGIVVEVGKNNFYTVKVGAYKFFVNGKDIK